jgi:phytoene dehydrogenase-like protein
MSGVRMACGAPLAAPLVFSTLSRKATLVGLAEGEGLDFAEWDWLRATKPDSASANLVFGLSALPAFHGVAVPPSARFVLAENCEAYEAAHAAARAGRLPDEPTLEFTLPSVSDPQLAPIGQHVMCVLVRPVPVTPAGGWDAAKLPFAASVMSTLERALPGFTRLVVAVEMLTPDQKLKRYGDDGGAPEVVQHLLADWHTRINTPIHGLYLCGRDAEPVNAVSWRAARIAVRIALDRERRP